MVGQRTLTPYVGVRLSRPQPNKTTLQGGFFLAVKQEEPPQTGLLVKLTTYI